MEFLKKQEPAHRRQQQQQSRRRKKLNNDNDNDNQANNNIHNNQPPTSILLPHDIILPITIQYLFVPQQNQTNTHQLQNHNSVLKTTPLFNYYNGQINRSIRKDCVSVNHNQIINNLESAPDIKTYKSPMKGELIAWSIIEGQVLHEHDGWRTCPIGPIKEPCTHAVQWHGQCAICGSDLTIGDCMGISENSRASIPMPHGPSTLTISVNEAERLENERGNRLLKAEKFSLIVDLDQTIVHAIVDPTVGEWMVDPSNPNWKALQKKEEVVIIILNKEWITRLFPVDTSMVVIIDDRGDVWEYSPNLVVVVPCEVSINNISQHQLRLIHIMIVTDNFFIGIEDINGAFLPPTQLLKPAPIEAELPPSSSSATVVVPITDPEVAEVFNPNHNGSTSSLPKVEEPQSSSTDNLSSSVDLPISSSPPSVSNNQEEMMAIAKACETSAVPISSSKPFRLHQLHSLRVQQPLPLSQRNQSVMKKKKSCNQIGLNYSLNKF
ncbi:hypothetical protein PSTT_10498 [Puccinia striiformis]|uniref:protein-serine/threonine phosphatase n=1 Tax=Puccinia striiformis TaxID=27350 RepID=A0A2S4V482_9BASI|nr:hypothetical protein PSTT_10498 [Puccinia striiformis]